MSSERRMWLEIRGGNSSALRSLLEASRQELTERDGSGDSLLTFACKLGQVACVEVLLDAGADVDAPGEHDLSPIWWAVRSKALSCVELLLARGADVRRKSKFASPLLEEVSFYNDSTASITGALLSARRWEQDELDRGLLRAAEQRRVEVIKRLLYAGANINFDVRMSPEPSKGVFIYPTPLSAAVSGLSFDAVQTILNSGVDINSRGALGDTVLHLLAKDTTIPIELISKLIFSGVDINIENNNGETATDVARKAKNGLFCRILASPRDVLEKHLQKVVPLGGGSSGAGTSGTVGGAQGSTTGQPREDSEGPTPAPPAPKRKTRRRAQEEQVYQLYYWEKVVRFVTRGPMEVRLPAGQNIDDYVRDHEDRLCEEMSEMPIVKDKDVDRKGGVSYEPVSPGRRK